MKLEEQFKQWLETHPSTSLRDIQCAIIAENFAIGFAEWIDKYYYQNQNEPNLFTECKEDIHNGKSFTIKQLLEIYKETL